MIFEVTEGKVSWLPDLRLGDLPDILPKGLSLHTRNNDLGLEAQGIVGTIPLKSGSTLLIVPKIGRLNFMRILLKAEGADTLINRDYDELVTYAVTSEETIESLVARELFHGLAAILSKSPMFRREPVRVNLGYPRGRVDWLKTTLKVASRNANPVVATSKEKNYNTAENCFLASAAKRAWACLTPEQRAGFYPIYEKWISRFDGSNRLVQEMTEIEERLAGGGYGGARDYYRKPLMLGRIIMGASGLGLDGSNYVDGDSMLLNTADIYERYLRNCIRLAYTGRGYLVSKGAGSSSLYTDGSYELNPDIVVSKDGECLLVLDAKYKSPDSGDHYQLVCYMKAYGVKRGALLSPTMDFDEVRIKEYATSDGLVCREVILPMGNMKLTEAFLASIVERLA